MPTNRTRRRRPATTPDAIAALRAGAALQYSPENRDLLIGAYYFGDHKLSAGEIERARLLLDRWRDQHVGYVRAALLGQ